MPLTIGTIASCYVFGAPTLIASPAITFIGDITTSVFLSSTTGTWSTPIISTTYEWLSSTDNTTWFTTNITQLSSSFFSLDNTYLRTIVRGTDRNLTPVSATSLSVYTSGMTFKPVVLQLNGDIVIPILKDTFIDSSTNNFTITKNGIPSQGTFSPFSASLSSSGIVYNPSVHGSSTYFNGTTDYLSGPSDSVFATGTNSFTVEGWVYQTSRTFGSVISTWYTNSSNGFVLGVSNTGSVHFIVGWAGTPGVNSDVIQTTTIIPLNTWTHIAGVRNGSTLTVYINGVASGTISTTRSLTLQQPFIGPYYANTPTLNLFNGYLANVRFVNSVLYTSNFTVPTIPVTLTTNGGATPSTLPTSGEVSLLCDFANASVLDGTGKNDLTLVGDAKVTNSVKKFGNGSLSFDGTGDYLFIPASSNLNILSGDFTIECFINVVQMPPSSSSIISQWKQSTGVGGYVLGFLNNGRVTFTFGAYSEINNLITTTKSLTAGTMSHVAITRSGSNFTAFIDGQNAGTAVYAGTRGDIGIATTLGNYLNSSGNFPANVGTDLNAYVDDLRITKGVARYPSQAFPTAALPNNSSGDANFSNVSLLLQADTIVPVPKDTFIDSSSNNFTITRNGSVTQGSFSPFPLYGAAYNPVIHGGSGYFNGVNGNYLSIPSNSAFNFASGTLTIECWVMFTALPTQTMIVANYNNTTTGWWLQQYGSSFIVGFKGDGNSIVGTTAIQTNVWYHVAVSGSTGSYKLFVNGVQEGTTYTGATSLAGGNLGIGAFGSRFPGQYVHNGYMSSLRIVNGTALYTSNFAVPAAPLTNVTNTSLLLNFTNSSVLDITSRSNVTISGDAKVTNTVKKYGIGALSFDGSGDYLSIPASSNLNLSIGDFTIEAWVYMNSGGSQYTLFNTQPHVTLAISLNRTGTGNTYVYTGNGSTWIGSPAIISSTNLSFNTWHHVALVKNGSVITLYHNGVSVGTTSSVPSGFNGDIYIGSIFTGSVSEFFNGYIDDFRITKAARYTGSTFTLPTTAYPVR